MNRTLKSERLDFSVDGLFDGQIDGAHEAVGTFVDIEDACHWPLIAALVLEPHENDISGLQVVSSSSPLGTLLEFREVTPSPANPELIGKILDSAPTTLAIGQQIFFVELFW